MRQKSLLKDSTNGHFSYQSKEIEDKFTCADGAVKLAGKDPKSPNLVPDSESTRPRRSESRRDSRRKGELGPAEQQSTDDLEAIDDFRSISGNCIFRHHVHPRVKFDMPREA